MDNVNTDSTLCLPFITKSLTNSGDKEITKYSYAYFPDVIIINNETTVFECDANGLVIYSIWFRSLCANHKRDDKSEILEFTEESEALKTVLDYMYFRKVPVFTQNDKQESLMPFLILCLKWQVDLSIFWNLFVNHIQSLRIIRQVNELIDVGVVPLPPFVQFEYTIKALYTVLTENNNLESISMFMAILDQWNKAFPLYRQMYWVRLCLDMINQRNAFSGSGGTKIIREHITAANFNYENLMAEIVKKYNH